MRMPIAAVLLVLAAAHPAFAQYGALAWSPSTGSSGQAWNASCADEAERSAIGYCGVGDCYSVTWVQNGCAALAVGDGGKYGWAWTGDRGTAAYNALQKCNGTTSGCRVVAWTCSG
jgi:hypothetical protein